MNKIITIAREYGSAGRIIAKKVSEKLGIQYYDNEIIDLVAKELGYDIETIRKNAEEKTSSFMYSLATTTNSLPLYDQVFIAQSKVIRHIAQKGSCIIVNGVADYVLEDYDHVLKVFIHAPLESRMKRVQFEYQEKHDQYKKYVLSKDKKRSTYYNYYTTNKWGQIKNFDLTLNSDLGIDAIVDTIVKFYKQDNF
ncbi:MAG: AAA family ATPase [Faecalibacillus sp.]